MTKIIIKVEKEDIHTSQIEANYMIDIKDSLALVFTPEALEELISDYNAYNADPGIQSDNNGAHYNTDDGTHQGRDFPFKDD